MTHFRHGIASLAIGLFISSFVGCNGSGNDGEPYQAGPPAQQGPSSTVYMARNLVSDGNATPYTDANLINAWGIAFNPTGFVWVAAAETSKSTLYDGNGVPQSLVVSIPPGANGEAKPTGIVYNGSQAFQASQGGVSAASPFLFVGEGGTLSAWSPSINRTQAITMFDGSAQGKIYKGLAIADRSSGRFLYAADFHNGSVDVFDGQFNMVQVPGGFIDSNLPAGYAPFGIQAIGNKIYVAYAMQDANAEDEIAGAGNGIVNVFDSDGNLLKRLISNGMLNAPWGMAMAPADFGGFSNSLLVANFGDGKINAYDAETGEYQGSLSGADGMPLMIDGLWGIAFGNGVNNQPTNTLFYTAGPGGEQHGVYGRIDMQ